MKVRNRLKALLNEAGIDTMRPTGELLASKLGGMSLIRFNQIWDNASKTELTVLETRMLNDWLASLFGSYVDVLESEPAKTHGG